MTVRAMRVALGLSLGLLGCSSVHAVYVRAGYDATAPAAIKRIAVQGWAPAEQATLGPVVAAAAADRIKLRMNYLVYATGALARGWSDACADRIDGVLVVRIRDSRADAETIAVDAEAELLDCRGGALVWRAEAKMIAEVKDPDLASLTESYVRQFGPEAARYAPVGFLVARDLLDTLPDTTLTDDEVLEKIELGATAPALRAPLARR